MLGAIGFYYRDFRQVSDEEVIEILQRFQKAAQKLIGRWRDLPPSLTDRMTRHLDDCSIL